MKELFRSLLACAFILATASAMADVSPPPGDDDDEGCECTTPAGSSRYFGGRQFGGAFPLVGTALLLGFAALRRRF